MTLPMCLLNSPSVALGLYFPLKLTIFVESQIEEERCNVVGVLNCSSGFIFPSNYPPFLVVSLLLNKSMGNHINSILSINS